MEFENLQIEVPLDESESLDALALKVYEKSYKNKKKDFIIGFNPNSKEAQERKARRAKRFGLKSTEDTAAEKPEDPFEKVDIYKLSWPPVQDEAFEDLRYDAIHVYGVNHMSTKDVFTYFDLYAPDSIEWIDDFSCNVMWLDEKSVMRAMNEMSQTFYKLQKIKPEKATIRNENNEVVEVVQIKQEETDDDEDAVVIPEEEAEAIQARDVWRIAVPWNENQLFFRPATVKDKKLPGAAQRSEYYLMYGKDPNATQYGPGIISSTRKRKLHNQKALVDERFRSNQPDVQIMSLAELKREGVIQKMEVDEDEPVVKRLNTFDENQTLTRTMHADRQEIQERLGDRYNTSVYDRLDDREMDARDRLGDARDRLGNRDHDNADYEDEIDDDADSPRAELGTDLRQRLDGSDVRSRLGNRVTFDKDTYLDHFEEGDDCFHDIYQADDTAEADRDNSSSRARREDSDSPPSHTDLRGRLKRKEEVKEEKVKAEFNDEKPNLCIEIKQESAAEEMEDSDDDNFEF